MQTLDSFWSLFQVSRITNNIFLYTLQSRVFWFCHQLTAYSYTWDRWECGQKKKMWLNSLNVDGFFDSLFSLSLYPSLPPTRNFIELSLASTRTYGSMETLGLISAVSRVWSMILFELFNSRGCFPEHWLVASSTVSLISCLDFRVTGEGVNLDM